MSLNPKHFILLGAVFTFALIGAAEAQSRSTQRGNAPSQAEDKSKKARPVREKPKKIRRQDGNLERGWKTERRCVRSGICATAVINQETGEVAEFDDQPAPGYRKTQKNRELVQDYAGEDFADDYGEIVEADERLELDADRRSKKDRGRDRRR